ncbi:MAG TPA: hypothetical protein VGR91_04330 [Stellaceae bacterium]|nr:hypothetical protein [Stellaceae bacterium]
MRTAVFLSIALLAGCAPWVDPVRVEQFSPGPNGTFIYGAWSNTAMTENEDGEAERIRREWLAEALSAHGMCPKGYVLDTRQLVQPTPAPFENGGDVVYKGSCL